MLINYPKIIRCKVFLVSQDLFDAKGMKTKDTTKETVRAFLYMITEKNQPRKFGSTKEQNFLENSKVCGTEGIQIYSIMIDTKAAFVERTTYNTILGKRSSPLHGRSWIQVH